MMSRIVPALLALALAGAQPALAAGTTPPGPWLVLIKEAVRQQLKNPEYVSFGRVFYADKKNGDGTLPVCGFASFKQKKTEHATRQPFFGLLTPPGNGKEGSFASIRLGATDAQADEIAKACKDSGVY